MKSNNHPTGIVSTYSATEECERNNFMTVRRRRWKVFVSINWNSLALIAFLFCGCSSRVADSPRSVESSSEKSDPSKALDWGGLKVQFAGSPMAAARRTIILLRGYGASGSDLVPLASVLGEGAATCFVFPEGPVRLGRDSYAWSDGNPDELERSRERLIATIDQIKTSNPNCRISVGGFSQGGTMALNLLSNGDPTLECVILYSPNTQIWREIAESGQRPKVFFSHGRNDKVLPFSAAENLKQKLESQGFSVNWQPFDGGHELNMDLLVATKAFLATSSERSVSP